MKLITVVVKKGNQPIVYTALSPTCCHRPFVELKGHQPVVLQLGHQPLVMHLNNGPKLSQQQRNQPVVLQQGHQCLPVQGHMKKQTQPIGQELILVFFNIIKGLNKKTSVPKKREQTIFN